MNLLSLPDIVAMLLLMGVLDWLRRKHRSASVDLWMLGLTFVLLERVAVAVLHGTPEVSRISHALALDSYVLAAVTFGWAARDDVIPGPVRLPLFLPSAVPLFVMTTLYGFDIFVSRAYLVLGVASLILGILYILLFLQGGPIFKARVLGIHLILWSPLIWMAKQSEFRLLIYWGLACMYMLVAVSFRRRIRRDGIGGLVIVTGFVVWALCFLTHPFVRDLPFYNDLNQQLWTMQKFLVIIGMLLVLLENQSRRLESEAMHDALTGLPNRRLFDDRLVQALSRARRSGLSAAVFVVDLNNFKHVNDTHGHHAGDLVLIRAGQVLKSKIRSSDTVARCGGDEFNVIVTDLTRPSDCERIAETLRTAITAVELSSGARFSLDASVGYAVFPADAADATELCELADIRMYKDKRTTVARSTPRIALSTQP